MLNINEQKYSEAFIKLLNPFCKGEKEVKNVTISIKNHNSLFFECNGEVDNMIFDRVLYSKYKKASDVKLFEVVTSLHFRKDETARYKSSYPDSNEKVYNIVDGKLHGHYFKYSTKLVSTSWVIFQTIVSHNVMFQYMKKQKRFSELEIGDVTITFNSIYNDGVFDALGYCKKDITSMEFDISKFVKELPPDKKPNIYDNTIGETKNWVNQVIGMFQSEAYKKHTHRTDYVVTETLYNQTSSGISPINYIYV